MIKKNCVYIHNETGNSVMVLGLAAGKGDKRGTIKEVVYTDKWFVYDGHVVMQRDGFMWHRSGADFAAKFSFARAAPLYDTKPFDPIPDPAPFEKRFQEELRSVFVNCLKILEERKASYGNNGMTVNDYMPFGHLSYAHMVQLKAKRIESLASYLHLSDERKQLIDLKDSLLDLINYTAFYAAWLEAK